MTTTPATAAPQRRNTRQRQLVLDAVRAHHDHPTADAIYLDVRAQDEHVSRGTVYRNLNLLADAGQIRAVRMPGGDRFDLRVDDHAHVVCSACGKVVDAAIPVRPELDDEVAAQTGFRVTAHATTFTGLCPQCRAQAEPAPPRFSWVMFDLDGTLLSSLRDLAEAAAHTCAQMGWPELGAEDFRHAVGHGIVRLVEELMPAEVARAARADGTYDALVEQALAHYRAHYAAHQEDHTAPFDGIRPLLEHLAAAGVRMGVLTNKDDAPAKKLVAREFGDLIELVQGREEGLAPKPDPAGARKLMAALGAEPARTLMVGDSEPDVQVGVRAGVAACGVLWGYRSREELLAAGAERIAATPAELERLILGQDA